MIRRSEVVQADRHAQTVADSRSIVNRCPLDHQRDPSGNRTGARTIIPGRPISVGLNPPPPPAPSGSSVNGQTKATFVTWSQYSGWAPGFEPTPNTATSGSEQDGTGSETLAGHFDDTVVETLTLSDSGQDSYSLYESGAFSAGSLSLGSVLYTDGSTGSYSVGYTSSEVASGYGTDNSTSQDTLTDGGQTGTSSQSDNTSTFSYLITSAETVTASGSGSSSDTESGAYSAGCFVFSTYIHDESGQDSDSESMAETLSFTSAGTESDDNEGISTGGVNGVFAYTASSNMAESASDMGVVYKARHLKLNRAVALKMILSGGHASQQDLVRFLGEAETVAQLQHPNVIQIFETGTHEGLPWFSLEFVEEGSLADKVRENLLSPRVAAVLTEQIARGVQAAHDCGIIHRDLKPDNVLMTSGGVPKVTDFGLAKRIEGGSGLTQTGAMMGTPSYMAPEQAEGKKEIGPAADVWGLGAILYRLLTGRPPFQGATTLDTIVQVLSEEPVPPTHLRADLPRDLETICLKCLRKDPDKRYPSAEALAADLKRWQLGEPIQARPVGRLERGWKLVRRHPSVSALVSLVILSLAVGSASTYVKYREAKKNAEDERVARRTADERAEQLKESIMILGSVFGQLDPKNVESGDQPLQAILGERLDKATTALEGESISDPRTMAELQTILGQSQLGLGYPEKAIVLYGKALATYQSLLGPDDPESLACMNQLALAYQDAGQFDRAVVLFEDTLKLKRAKFGLEGFEVVNGTQNLARAYEAAGKLDRAVQLLEEVYRFKKSRLAPDDPELLTTMNNLGAAYQEAGKLDQAQTLFAKTLEIRKSKLGPDHLDTLTSIGNLAAAEMAAGKFDAGIALLEEQLRLQRSKLGSNHLDTLRSMANVAEALRQAGKPDQAVPALEEAYKLQKSKLGADHPLTLSCMHNLALAYEENGRFDLALPLLEENLRLRQGKLGPNHPESLSAMNSLGTAYEDVGQSEKAVAILEKSLELHRAKLGPTNAATLVTMNNLAEAYHLAGKSEQALALAEDTYKLMKSTLGPSRFETLASMNTLARDYQALGKLDRAIDMFEQTLEGMKSTLGPQHPTTLTIMANLAVAHLDAKQLEKAIALLEVAYRAGGQNPSLAWLGPRLLEAYAAAGKFDAAIPIVKSELAKARATNPPASPQLASALSSIATYMLPLNQFAEAEPILRECVAIREKNQPNVWSTFNAQSLLGGALLGQKKYASAEPLLLAGYQGIKERQSQVPASSTRPREALERLIRLYDSWGKPDEAAKWRKELTK